jgi:hypothetical protein
MKDISCKICATVSEDILILELVFSMKVLGSKTKNVEEVNR